MLKIKYYIKIFVTFLAENPEWEGVFLLVSFLLVLLLGALGLSYFDSKDTEKSFDITFRIEIIVLCIAVIFLIDFLIMNYIHRRL